MSTQEMAAFLPQETAAFLLWDAAAEQVCTKSHCHHLGHK